jgi:hypothetical protein
MPCTGAKLGGERSAREHRRTRTLLQRARGIGMRWRQVMRQRAGAHARLGQHTRRCILQPHEAHEEYRAMHHSQWA